MNTAITDVAQNGRKQTGGIAEVNRAIREIGGITQKNAMQAEQASSSASELMGQVDALERLVAVFKVDVADEQEQEHDTTGQHAA